jgi:hypothetical protein
MNKIEKKMLSILIDLKKNCGVIGVKAEFEAEGTRTEELLRLLDIARRADLKIALKIGGCEAVRDIIEAMQFGVDYIIAPMVETPYALEKFVEAKNKIFSIENREDVDFMVNIETNTGYGNLNKMVEEATKENGIQGIVFGRVDYVGSLGRSRDLVDTHEVTDTAKKISKQCKDHKLDLVVGGGVSINALTSLREIRDIHLTRFETRKIIFSANALEINEINRGLLEAVHFELLWLLNKREYYSNITKEDDKRIEMLDNRWKILNKN